MEGRNNTADVAILPKQAERWQALVDILYLTQVVWLYVFAAAYPLMGLFYGIVLSVGSVSPRAKRVGRICLILGIINLVLCSLIIIGLLILSLTGMLAGLAAD